MAVWLDWGGWQGAPSSCAKRGQRKPLGRRRRTLGVVKAKAHTRLKAKATTNAEAVSLRIPAALDQRLQLLQTLNHPNFQWLRRVAQDDGRPHRHRRTTTKGYFLAFWLRKFLGRISWKLGQSFVYLQIVNCRWLLDAFFYFSKILAMGEFAKFIHTPPHAIARTGQTRALYVETLELVLYHCCTMVWWLALLDVLSALPYVWMFY